MTITYGEYKFVITKPYLNYHPEVSGCAIYGPETPLPAHDLADVRVVYDRSRGPHEVAAILRELADHIETDNEFLVEYARHMVADSRFGTGEYNAGFEQRMRDTLARHEAKESHVTSN